MADVIVLKDGLVALNIVDAINYWKELDMSIPKEYLHLVPKPQKP